MLVKPREILVCSFGRVHLPIMSARAHQEHEAAINCEEAKDGVPALVMEELLPE